MDDVKVLMTEKHYLNFTINLDDNAYFLDEKLIKQILLNLLSNAVKYSVKGGIIGFTVKAIEDNIIFEVIDEGIGIPQEDMANLFEPFNRGRNVGNIHGTGLGMSIIKRSIDLFGGSISFDSKEGTGTKFIVKIPNSK